MSRLLENPTELLRFVNIAVGGTVIAGGVGSLIKHKFSSIIIGVYEVLAGLIIIGLEIRDPTSQQKELVHKYASFLHSFLGRGVFYVLLGVLLLNYYKILYVCGTIVGVAGLAFIVLHFFPLFEPPSTMQPPQQDVEAQPVWQGPTE